MTIQGIGQSYYTYASLFASSGTSSTTSGTGEASSAFELPPEPMDVTEIMDQDDANSDGVLTLDETPLSQEMFSSADADGDGELTSDELEEMLASVPPPPMGGPGQTDDLQDAESIMEADDANGDGVLTFDETPLTEEMFASADENGDGELSSEELETYVTTAPGAGDSQTDLEGLSELSASATATMIMNAYETAGFNGLFSQGNEDNSSYQSLLSSLVI